MRLIIFILSLFILQQTNAQTLGGNSVFNFLKLSSTPQLTALGNVNTSVSANDIGLAYNNPAQLTKDMHTQMNAVFNSYYAGIKNYHLSFGYHHPKLNTNFAMGLQYFDYGQIPQTDPSGNIFGNFRPTDWAMQVSASRQYLQRWSYGLSLKFIHSGYSIYKSSGIAMDVGVHYHDSSGLFTASVLAKNMGFQLKSYTDANPEDIPFDLQIGMTQRLKNAPFAFSVTAQRVHQFDIRYNDTLFNNDNGIGNKKGKFTADKLFRHFVFASQIFIGDHVEFIVAYNHLRRQELNITNTANGMNGFSIGAAAKFKKIQIRYARSQYQNNTGLNQVGLNLKLNEYFGLGKFGERVGW